MKRKVLSGILSLVLVAGLFFAAPAYNAAAAPVETFLIAGDGWLQAASPWPDGQIYGPNGDSVIEAGALKYNAGGAYCGFDSVALNKISTQGATIAEIDPNGNSKYLNLTMKKGPGSANVESCLMTIGLNGQSTVKAYISDWNAVKGGIVLKGAIQLTEEYKTFSIPLDNPMAGQTITAFKTAEVLALNSDPSFNISGSIYVERIFLSNEPWDEDSPVINTTQPTGDSQPTGNGEGSPVIMEDQKAIGDVNGDGEVNAADALLILKKSVGRIDKFAVETQGYITVKKK